MGTPQSVLHQVGPACFVASSSHLLSTYYVLGSTLRAICSFTHWRLTTTRWDRYYYHLSHFTNEKTVAGERWLSQGHLAYYLAEPGFEPRWSYSGACALSHNSIPHSVSQLDEAPNLGKQGRPLTGQRKGVTPNNCHEKGWRWRLKRRGERGSHSSVLKKSQKKKSKHTTIPIKLIWNKKQ